MPPVNDDSQKTAALVQSRSHPIMQTAALNQAQKSDLDNLPYLDYRPQSEQEIIQLDTEEDKNGIITTTTRIVKKIRDVYGRTPQDMKGIDIDWAIWKVTLNPKHRPSPYEFPAFERQAQEYRIYQHNDKSKSVSRVQSDLRFNNETPKDNTVMSEMRPTLMDDDGSMRPEGAADSYQQDAVDSQNPTDVAGTSSLAGPSAMGAMSVMGNEMASSLASDHH